jgi:predicted phage-related endonuclease
MSRSIIPRHDYIGGSAAATILGKNDYEARLGLWERKHFRQDLDLSDNRHVMRGNLVEPIVEEWVKTHVDPTINTRENWEKYDFGLAQRRFEEREADAQIMLMDPEPHPITGKPYIGGHPDGLGDEILWEFKVPTSYKLERVIKDGMPDSWYYQILHYMMISGLKRGCLAMWSWDRWEPYLIWVEPDPFIYAVMREEYERFWNYVATGERPPADAETTFEREHQEVVEDPKVDEMLKAYQDAYDKRYSGKDEQEAARAQFLSWARGRSRVITPNYTASITEMTRYGKSYTRLTVRENDKVDDDG